MYSMTIDEAIGLALMEDAAPTSHEAAEAAHLLATEVNRLNTWDGLMSLLDRYYPADVFDGSSGDEGPRITSLIRTVDGLRADDSLLQQVWRVLRHYAFVRPNGEAWAAVVRAMDAFTKSQNPAKGAKP